MDVYLFADAFDVEPVERLDRAHGLAVRRAEGGEIMLPDQPLRRAVHGLGIRRRDDLPGAVAIQGQRRPAVDDAIKIAPPGAGEARVPVGGDHFALRHRDRIGTQVRVDRPHQPKGREPRVDIAMTAHRHSVDPGISPTRAVQRDPLAVHPMDCGLDRALDAGSVLLALEAEEGAAVEFESERETGCLLYTSPSPRDRG